MAEPVINVGGKASFKAPPAAEAAGDSASPTPEPTSTAGGLQNISIGTTFTPGPVRNIATNLEDSFGLEARAQYRTDNDSIYSGGVEVRTRTDGERTSLDTRLKFYAVDAQTLLQLPNSHLGVVLVQRAGFDAVITERSDGEKTGGFRPGNSDEIAIGIRSGRSWYPNMLSIAFDHGSPLLSTDETAAPWGITQGFYLGWSEKFYGPRDDLEQAKQELRNLQGDDGKGGEYETRRNAKQRLQRLSDLLSDVEEVEKDLSKPRYDLDLIVYRFADLDDIDSLARQDFIEPLLQKKIEDAALPEADREKLEALQGEIGSGSIADLLDNKEKRENGRLLADLFREVDREKFSAAIRSVYLKEKRAFDKRYEDLDSQVTAARERINALEERARKSLIPYHAANIVTRSWTSIQMNNLARDVYSIEGTQDKGKMFLLAVNPLYDIPLILSVESIVQDAEGGLGALSAAALGAFGVFEMVQGKRGGDFGQLSNGLVLTTAVVESLPGLFRGRKETTGKLARVGIVAAAAVGFGIAGVLATTNDDKGDDAMGYRLMSIGLNQALAGGVIFRW